MTSESIDGLLARYLGLLHEYTELRSQLASRQTSMYGSLARANFTAERGFRYGPDHFDGRMQALVRVAVSADSGSGDDSGKEQASSFAVVRPKKEAKAEATETAENDEENKQQQQQDDAQADNAKKNDVATRLKQKDGKKTEAKGPRDPLQWFGMLTPMALRQAQHEAIAIIDTIVPQLASVSAEMTAVEIEVRRARKKRARAATTQEKQDKQASASSTTATGESSSMAAVSV